MTEKLVKSELSKPTAYKQLGDNPSCSSGPPITMGWNYSQKEEISLDDVADKNEFYVGTKPPRRIIDPFDRYGMLRNAGYSRQEIESKINDVCKARKQRCKSAESNQISDKVNEVVEDFSKKIKSLSKSKGDKSQEDLLLHFATFNGSQYRSNAHPSPKLSNRRFSFA